MKAKIIILVVALLLLLGAGGFYLYSQKQNTQTNSSVSPTSTQKHSTTPNNILDLILSSKTQTCTFNYKAPDGISSSGTLYLTPTRMRGDIVTTSKDEKSTNVYMLRDSEVTYVWGDSLPMGIKMNVSLDVLKTNTQANQYFNTRQNVDYKCSAWTVDSSKFAIPTNIKFTDVSSMMKATPAVTLPETNSGN